MSDSRRRPRRSARREAQIRRRRFVALTVAVVTVAIVALLATSATRAGAAPTPGASAVLASLAGESVGSIRIDPSVASDEATVNGSHRSRDLRFDDGVATVSSFLVGTALVSETDVSLSDVNLLDGIVKADSVELVATASAGRASAAAESAHSFISGLRVNGQPVAADPGQVQIPGVGTLAILDATIDQSRPSPSTVVTGLEIVLDHQVGDLAAGSVVVCWQADKASIIRTTAEIKHRLIFVMTAPPF